MSAWDELLSHMRSLHQRAGYPSSRAVARAVAEADGVTTLSHTTVAKVLSNKGSTATFATFTRVAQALAVMAHGRDRAAVDREVQEVRKLWHEVDRELRGDEEPSIGRARSTAELMLEELRAIRALLEDRLPRGD